MHLAGCADRILPMAAGKPGEFAGGLAVHSAAPCPAETADIEDYAGGIEKGMEVGALLRHRLAAFGDQRAAGTAEDRFFRVYRQPVLGSGLRQFALHRALAFPAQAPGIRPSPRDGDSGQQWPAPYQGW